MATIPINIGTGSGGVGTTSTEIKGTFDLGGDTGESFDFAIYNANSPAVVQYLSLSSGANTINSTTCPALAQCGGVVLIPPSGNGQTITLKGVSGDTGIALSLTAPTVLTFAVSPPSSFVLTTNGTIAGFKLAFF